MIYINAVDPTRTVTLRNAYAVDMRRRFRLIRSLIIKTVADNDALGLGSGPPPVVGFQAGPANRFDFPTDISKVDAFMAWLNGAVDSEVLEVISREGRTVTAHRAWQNSYVRGGYRSGVLSANTKLRGAGVTISPADLFQIFNSPRHADSLGLLFTRNFNALQGISEAMANSISRALADGMASGIGPREMAANLVAEIDITLNRATVLARTEIIRAHAEATLNRYQDFGLKEVMGFAEFKTAGDDRVCVTCEDLDGELFPIDEARGVIPVHAQCRCTWEPVIPEGEILGRRLGFFDRVMVSA